MTRHRTFCAACAAAALLSGPAAAAGAPTPTPTPAPRARLSGGFGRAPSAPRDGDPRSLGDAVRAARRRKEQKEQKAVAITNDSLVKDPKQGHVSTSRIQPAAPPTAPPTASRIGKGEGGAAAAPAASASTAGEESVWRERARSLQRRVDDFKTQIARLEAETKQLEGDFYRWDDGQYRDRVIKPAWDKKREELETAKIQGKQAEADLADLPEKARKAGVPPGWLRE